MPDAPERILIRGVNWLGDAVMTTPALRRLREAHAHAHVALLTHAKLADLWKHHPDIDQVLTFQPGDNVWSVARHLRPLDFDTALVLPNSPRSALEVFLAGIPRRIGLARPWRNWFLTERLLPRPDEVAMRKPSLPEIRLLIDDPKSTRFAPPPAAHHLHHYLYLAAALKADPTPCPPHLAVLDSEVEAMRRRFGLPSMGAALPPLLGLNAGAEYGPAKRWPAERFIETALAAQRETGCHCWVFGGAADVPLARSIADAITKSVPPDSVRCLAGQTSLRELCAALKACDVVLTNDTGPMHVAAAVGTSVVVPFGSTSPELTGPGLPGDPHHRCLKSDAPCSPCFLPVCPIDFRCMHGIATDRVAATVIQSLRHRSEKS